jgi:uncharacterized membrane protein HdeD (DUF308 family)
MGKSIESKLNYWYLLLIFGLILISLGFLVFYTPEKTFLVLAVFFSYGFMLSGLLETIYSLLNRSYLPNWGWYFALGLLTFILGIQLMVHPSLSVMLLTFYIGFWLLFRSMMYISSAIDLKKVKSSNWFFVLILGILGVIFSLALLWNPVLTSIAVSVWIGCALVSLGLLQVVLSFSLKRIKNHLND